MDFNSIEGRKDFFLLLLHTDRLNRILGATGMKESEFALNLQVACDAEPKIDSLAFLIDLQDAGYVEPNAFGHGKAFLLTKEGSDFIKSGGFTELERKRILELKKDIKVGREHTWYYPVLIISVSLNVILIIANVLATNKSQSPKNSAIQKPPIDTIYIYSTAPLTADSAKIKH